ncbi:MAG TPA: response regulator [Phycisphaerales bacterium]|nr:response regulator [Phycisphaerales bacterium]
MIFETKKVLVCDDQHMLRELLQGAILTHSPYCKVTQASNGKIAEDLLRQEKFDIVFMDVEMPVQDGFTTLKNIREGNLAEGTPVVMCTGCSDESDLVRGWQLRADYYLTKPFDLDEISDVLADLMPMRSVA